MDGSGTMWTVGGWRPAVLFAGYAGSFVVGALLWLAASWSSERGARVLCAGLALLPPAAALAWGSWRDPATALVCLAVAAVPLLALRSGVSALPRLAMRFVGAYVTVCAFVAPTWQHTAAGKSDAADLRDLTGVPVLVWIGLWLAFGAAVQLAVLRLTLATGGGAARPAGRPHGVS